MNLKKYKISDESLDEESNEYIQPNKSIISEVEVNRNKKEKEIVDYNVRNVLEESAITHMQNHELPINISNIDEDVLSNKQQEKMENYHHVQIIDEDVENFKRRLDITLKNFRTDTLKDFMSIKRHLLVEQKAVIDSEKQKCDAQIGAKTDQIEHLKESLAKTKNALTKESEVKERMASHLYKIKNGKYVTKLKSMAFVKCLKKFYLQKKKNKLVSIYYDFIYIIRTLTKLDII